MSELGEASGRDLSEWTRGWLDTAGTDRLTLTTDDRGAVVLLASGPGGGEPRPHRIDIGLYDGDGSSNGDSLSRRGVVSLETTGASTPVPDVDDAHLLLVNDDDLTFASVRPPAGTVSVLLSAAPKLPTAVSRALAVTTAWDMLVNGELPSADFVGCVTAVLPREQVESVVEPYLQLAVDAADLWSPEARREELMAQVAATCLTLADDPARRTVALRALARTAVSDAHVDRLRAAGRDDIELSWRTLVRLAEVATVTDEEIDALSAADPDPDAWVRALAVRAARPDAAAKDLTWKAVVDDRSVPMGSLGEVRRAFWRRSQGELLAPYADRYLAVLPQLHRHGMIPALSVSNAMYPRAGVDAAFADRAVAAARADGVSPVVARTVIENTDQLHRMLQARSLSAP